MQVVAFVLMVIALVFYVVAWCLYLYRNVRHNTNYEKLASRLITVAFFAQTMAIAALTVTSTSSFFNTGNVLLLISWLLFFACFMFEVVSKKRDFGVYLFAVPIVLLTLSLFL